VPRGNTALYDAIGRTVNDTVERLKELPKSETPDRVLFVIITDGKENSSKDFHKADIKALIDFWEGCYCSNWKFVYLAVGFDGFDEAVDVGFSSTSIDVFNGSTAGWLDVGNVLTNTATTFRSGGEIKLNTD
jgi:hypothetical protein